MERSGVIEKRGLYRGFEYVVKLIEDGYRCGYVRIREDHPLLGAELFEYYDHLSMEYWNSCLKCHGGITFYRFVNYHKHFGRGHWVGFDCSHEDDAYDFDAATKVFGDSEVLEFHRKTKLFDDGVVRDLDFVIKECEHIIDQLMALSKGVYRYES